MKPPTSDLIIRRVGPQDDLSALTELIHAAYAPHAAQGLRYWGTHQSVEDTAKRLQSGLAWLMLQGSKYVGTATLRPPQPESPVSLYRQVGVHSLAQFCVCPSKKGAGLGKALHGHVLAAAQELGAQGIALDTARPATALIRLYESWGYKVVGQCDWRPHTNYESVVMYRALSMASAENAA